AATDFVITKTLSAADAAEHLLHNPFWDKLATAADLAIQEPWLQWLPAALHSQLAITMTLLVILGAFFLRGFRDVIGLAVVLVAAYLLLNAVIIGAGLAYLAAHPELFQQWLNQLANG